jgi:prepilin-type N-terminal cleavage/methylation domain-containing protein
MNCKRKEGLTLTEVMVACAILGLVLSAMIGTCVMGQKSVVFANNRLIAMHEARRVMEGLLEKSYSSSDWNVGNHNLSNGVYVVTQSGNVKTVAVAIRWTDPTRAATSSVELASCLSSVAHK